MTRPIPSNGPAVTGITSLPAFPMKALAGGRRRDHPHVASNPLMRDGSKGAYSRNISMGRFVKAIGLLAGPVFPVIVARGVDSSGPSRELIEIKENE
jgi:MFS transporter, FHS family, L-fucose permease